MNFVRIETLFNENKERPNTNLSSSYNEGLLINEKILRISEGILNNESN